MSNYIHDKDWDEITYPFPNFNYGTVEVWKRISNFIHHFSLQGMWLLSRVGIKFKHVSKWGPKKKWIHHLHLRIDNQKIE